MATPAPNSKLCMVKSDHSGKCSKRECSEKLLPGASDAQHHRESWLSAAGAELKPFAAGSMDAPTSATRTRSPRTFEQFAAPFPVSLPSTPSVHRLFNGRLAVSQRHRLRE